MLIIENNNTQYIDSQLDKGSAFFFNWLEMGMNEKDKSLILNEIESYQKTLLNVTPGSHFSFSKSFLNALYQAAQGALVEGLGEEASQIFLMLSHLIPNSYDVFLGLGMTYQLLKEHQKATESYQQAIHIHPQAFQAYLYIAESYLELQDKEKFEENIQRARALIPREKDHFQQHVDYLIQKFKPSTRS
ncbi:MAG: hypothetical protein KDK76_01735 [Chlamydiia bacterium]|nr:hypothetical protein [Chlamydiia bacterium]